MRSFLSLARTRCRERSPKSSTKSRAPALKGLCSEKGSLSAFPAKSDLYLQNRSDFSFCRPLYFSAGGEGVEVYIEYALAENFLLDGALLYLAQKTVRLPVGKARLFFAAACGAAFAVVFPFFKLAAGWAFAVRYLFGALLCLVAVRARSVKEYALAILFFYLYTFAFGGLLLGMYAFFDIDYDGAGGYFIAQAPLGAVLCGGLVFLLLVRRLFSALYRRYRRTKLLYRCRIALADGREIAGMGLLDTGNSLMRGDRPVCLLDPVLALELFGAPPPREDMESLRVHTATGDGELKIFPARIEIYSAAGKNIIENVYFALTPARLGRGYQIVLHPQLFKEVGRRVERTFAKDTGPVEKTRRR